MTPERWKQIEALYHAALERKGEDRFAFLKQTCGADEELRREVEARLTSRDNAADFMNRPALEEASRELGRERERKMVGQRIDGCQILSFLGAGGMGESIWLWTPSWSAA